MVELRVLVQGKDGLDVDRINEFVSNCDFPRLVLLYSSLESEALCVGFFEKCIQGLDIPFIGVRTPGCFTREGYHEDSVVIGVLCGEFEVKVVHECIDFTKLVNVADKLIPQLDGFNLAIVHSANMYEQLVFVDGILRRVNAAHPGLQIVGGCSSPNPIVACNGGMFNDHLVIALIRGVGFEHRMFSGFSLKEDCMKYKVTRSEEYYVNEINGRNAADFVSGLYHVQPYFFNMLSGLTTRSNISRLYVELSKANPLIEKAISGGIGKPPCQDIRKNIIDVYLPVKLYEKESRFLTTSHISKGSVLQETETSSEKQVGVYEQVLESFKEKNILVFPCGALPTLFGCSNNKVVDKLKNMKKEFIVAYMWGEYGTIMPYKSIEENVIHGGSVQVLGFK